MQNELLKHLHLFLLSVIILSMMFSGCTEQQNFEISNKNIYSTLYNNEEFSVLRNVLNLTECNQILKNNSSSITLFAPTNSAFNNLKQGYLTTLITKDLDLLNEIVSYHILLESINMNQLLIKQRIETVQGKYITIERSNDKNMIDGVYTNGDYINCTNGVIYIIDAVLFPKKNIVKTIDNYTILNTFSSLLKKSEYKKILQEENSLYTVFVPTDEAFLEINDLYNQTFLKNDSSHFVLNYILKGDINLETLTNNSILSTINNKSLTITLENNEFYINDASIILSDISCSNGKIHIIDKVLI